MAATGGKWTWKMPSTSSSSNVQVHWTSANGQTTTTVLLDESTFQRFLAKDPTVMQAMSVAVQDEMDDHSTDQPQRDQPQQDQPHDNQLEDQEFQWTNTATSKLLAAYRSRKTARTNWSMIARKVEGGATPEQCRLKIKGQRDLYNRLVKHNNQSGVEPKHISEELLDTFEKEYTGGCDVLESSQPPSTSQIHKTTSSSKSYVCAQRQCEQEEEEDKEEEEEEETSKKRKRVSDRSSTKNKKPCAPIQCEEEEDKEEEEEEETSKKRKRVSERSSTKNKKVNQASPPRTGVGKIISFLEKANQKREEAAATRHKDKVDLFRQFLENNKH
ncbi:myb-like protein V [Littorina saxatilis]|uniref:MADF domain-containing protein n=1 Tax=Littorina saxatilis TaxID=31220 RepID=A0AAN9ALV6_9CAEN